MLVTVIPPECTNSVELFEDPDLDVAYDHLSYLRTQIIGFKLKHLSLKLREYTCLCSFAFNTITACVCSFYSSYDFSAESSGVFLHRSEIPVLVFLSP